MDSGKARELYLKYAAAMAYVAVRRPDGTTSIGSAFHVGEGVFVTARHVVEDGVITEVATTEYADIPLSGDAAKDARAFLHTESGRVPIHTVRPVRLEVTHGPYLDAGTGADVVAFRVRTVDPYLPAVPLGDHLDDWIGANDFVMSEAVVLGYPPIPMTTEPYLVAARAEVNAIVHVRGVRHPHFILSSMPRGGFSGGLALSEYGFALGVITHSVLVNDAPSELGFMAVLSIEPIFECLTESKMLPQAQTEGWEGFWNTETTLFLARDANESGGRVAASVDAFDNGESRCVVVHCSSDPAALAEASRRAEAAVPGGGVRASEIRPGIMKLEIPTLDATATNQLRDAAEAAMTALSDAGYVKLGT